MNLRTTNRKEQKIFTAGNGERGRVSVTDVEKVKQYLTISSEDEVKAIFNAEKRKSCCSRSTAKNAGAAAAGAFEENRGDRKESPNAGRVLRQLCPHGRRSGCADDLRHLVCGFSLLKGRDKYAERMRFLRMEGRIVLLQRDINDEIVHRYCWTYYSEECPLRKKKDEW